MQTKVYSVADFQVGQKVRCVSGHGVLKVGSVHTIARINTGLGTMSLGPVGLGSWYAHRFVPAEPPKFNVGDTVQLVKDYMGVPSIGTMDNLWLNYTKVKPNTHYKVLRVDANGNIDVEDGGSLWLNPYQFELVRKAEVAPAYPFKVGQRVRCIDGFPTEAFGPRTGETYTVEEINSKYVFLKGVGGGWYHDRFVAVPEVAPPAFLLDPLTAPTIGASKLTPGRIAAAPKGVTPVFFEEKVKRIVRAKVLSMIITGGAGKFSCIYTKADGSDRTINALLTNTGDNNSSLVTVKELNYMGEVMQENGKDKYRNVNLNTIKRLTVNNTTWVVAD